VTTVNRGLLENGLGIGSCPEENVPGNLAALCLIISFPLPERESPCCCSIVSFNPPSYPTSAVAARPIPKGIVPPKRHPKVQPQSSRAGGSGLCPETK